MTFVLPYPTSPSNGDAGNADPVRLNLQALAQAIQSFDGSQIQAASIQEAALANGINPRLRDSETLPSNFFYVTNPAAAWSAAGGLVGTRVSATAYIQGYRTLVSAIGSKTFTASKDTWVSIDYLGNVTYSEVANNATPPSLPANSVWDAVVITDASSITMIHDLRTFSSDMLARIQIGGNTNNIVLPNIPLRSHLRAVVQWFNNGGAAQACLRFNGDSSTIYPFRFSKNGAADSVQTGQTLFASGPGTSGQWSERILDISNVATGVKTIYSRETHSIASGASAPDRFEISGTWPNTSAQINRIDIANAGSGTFGTGTEMMVYN